MTLDSQQLDRFRPYLIFLARTQLYDGLAGKADASDIVQQTLLQAYRAADDFRGDDTGALLAWLRRILANTIAKEGRRFHTQKRNVQRERSIEGNLHQSSARLGEWLAAEQTTPLSAVAQAEQMVLVAAAVEQLPGDQREAIIMHYWKGMTISEVSEQMQRTSSSVAGLIYRGLQTIRKSLP